jgi:hypothetical protein
MYARKFEKAGLTRRFIITSGGSAGWEVREERNSLVVRQARYTDWHRVERARMAFAQEAATLTSSGWKES